MKYNENAFDKIMENYELDDIVNEKIVRSDAVKNSAFEQLGLGEKKKKHFNKKAVGFIAAAAALTVIGTSVIALNPLRDAFKGYIDIKDDVPVYAGDNVQIQSDKSNVELKGVICDDTMFFATLEITKKDGTPFTDDISKSYVLSYNKKELLNTTNGLYDDQQIFFSEFAPDENDTQEEYEEKMLRMVGHIDYDFMDKNTVKGFLEYNNERQYDFQGKTMKISEGKIYIYKIGECVYNYSEFNGNAKFNYDIYRVQVENITEKYKNLLKENQILDYKSGNNSIYIATIEETDVDYKVSFDVNYTPKNLVADIDTNKKYKIDDSEFRFDYVEIKPFKGIIKGTCKGEWNWEKLHGGMVNREQKVFYKYGALSVEMKDGTVAKTSGMSCRGGYTDQTKKDIIEFEFGYEKFYDENDHFIAINPQNIKAIYFCDEKIYG